MKGIIHFINTGQHYFKFFLSHLKNKDFVFEISIVDHCNLNCVGCDHFSPLIKDSYYCRNDLKNDLENLRQIQGIFPKRIRILGGEPLLHPEINEIMTDVYNVFPKARIEIVTNGLLINKMPERFWEICKECHIDIEITRYPIKIDYLEMKKYISQKGVRYLEMNANECIGSKGNPMQKFALDLAGKQNIWQSFLFCYKPGSCTLLSNG